MANTSLQYMPDLSRGPDYSAANSMFQAGQRGISEAGTVFGKLRQSILDEEQRKWDQNFKEAQEAERIRQFNETYRLQQDRLNEDIRQFDTTQEFNENKEKTRISEWNKTFDYNKENNTQKHNVEWFKALSSAVDNLFDKGYSRSSRSSGSGNSSNSKESFNIYPSGPFGEAQFVADVAAAAATNGSVASANSESVADINRRAAALRLVGQLADRIEPGTGQLFFSTADSLRSPTSSQALPTNSSSANPSSAIVTPSSIDSSTVTEPVAARTEQLVAAGTNTNAGTTSAPITPAPEGTSTPTGNPTSLSGARQEAVTGSSSGEISPSASSDANGVTSSNLLKKGVELSGKGDFAATDIEQLAKKNNIPILNQGGVSTTALSAFNTQAKNNLEIALHDVQTDLGVLEQRALDISKQDPAILKEQLKDPNISADTKLLIETSLNDKNSLYLKALKPVIEARYKGLHLPSTINSLAELNTAVKNYLVQEHVGTYIPFRRSDNTFGYFKASISPSELKDSEQYTEANKFAEERKKLERDKEAQAATEVKEFIHSAEGAKAIIKKASGTSYKLEEINTATVTSARNIVKFLNETFDLKDKDTVPFFKKNAMFPRWKNWIGSDLEDGKVLLSILQDPEFEAKILGKSNNSEYRKELLKYYRDIIRSENSHSIGGLEMDDKTFTYLTNTRPKDKPSLNDARAAIQNSRQDSTSIRPSYNTF